MKTLQKNKGMLLAIALFIAVIFFYNSFFKGETMPAEEASASAVGTDLVNLFNTLQAVSLTTDLFSSPAYRGLTDFSAEIPDQPVGRTNPFDPIGR